MNKKNRVAQRPLLMAISEIDKMIRTLKSSGKEMGFSYPEVVPSVKVMSPSPVQDHTSYESANPFPLPDFTDIFDGVIISPEQRKIIEDNMAINAKVLTDYQSKVSSGVLGLYDKLAESTVKLEDFLTFYFTLASHNDAVQLEDARDVMSCIFKPEVRPYIK